MVFITVMITVRVQITSSHGFKIRIPEGAFAKIISSFSTTLKFLCLFQGQVRNF